MDVPNFASNENKRYESYSEALIDDFEKIENKILIDWFMLDEIQMNEAKFTSLSDILSKIGGFSSILLSIFTAASTISFSMFLKKVALNIKRKEKVDKDQSAIVQIIKDTCSYDGIYSLNAKVESA